jgi:hypothetical protein
MIDVLVRHHRQGDFGDIQLSRFDEMQQKVERTLEDRQHYSISRCHVLVAPQIVSTGRYLIEVLLGLGQRSEGARGGQDLGLGWLRTDHLVNQACAGEFGPVLSGP